MNAVTKKLLLTADAECKRILSLSNEEIMAEHLALYAGNAELARKSIDMLRAQVQALLAERWKQ